MPREQPSDRRRRGEGDAATRATALHLRLEVGHLPLKIAMPLATTAILKRGRDGAHRLLVLGRDPVEEPHAATAAHITRGGDDGWSERHSRVEGGPTVAPRSLGRRRSHADVEDVVARVVAVDQRSLAAPLPAQSRRTPLHRHKAPRSGRNRRLRLPAAHGHVGGSAGRGGTQAQRRKPLASAGSHRGELPRRKAHAPHRGHVAGSACHRPGRRHNSGSARTTSGRRLRAWLPVDHPGPLRRHGAEHE
jgi:hypothetical protein